MMERIELDPQDIAPGRLLRLHFARFWSEAQKEPRDSYDRFIAQTPIASGSTFCETDMRGAPGLWCLPADAMPGRAILFLHGGGYVLGSATAYRGLVSQIAVRTKVPVFLLDYPLAPETKLPVALSLAVDTLERLQKRFPAVAICGDSAGGGMTLAALDAAQPRGIPIAAAAVFSPWTDLTLSGESARDLVISDPLLDVAYLQAAAAGYLGSAPAEDPRASPLMDVPGGLPPILIQVGADEVLLDDSRRYAEAAQAAGNDVALEVWQGMHHVFQLNVAELVSARRALDRTAAFLFQRMSARRVGTKLRASSAPMAAEHPNGAAASRIGRRIVQSLGRWVQMLLTFRWPTPGPSPRSFAFPIDPLAFHPGESK